MKKVFLTLAVVLIFAATGSAQVSTPVSIYAGGALSVPASGDFNAGWQMGYHGAFGLGYKLAPNFQVVGNLEYHHFFFDMADFMGLDGGDTKVWMYGVNGRYSLGLPVVPIKPFFIGGAGIAKMTWDEFEGPTLITATLNAAIPESVNKVYFNFGGGLDLKVIPTLSLFIEARYVSIATDGASTAFVPMTVGLRFF